MSSDDELPALIDSVSDDDDNDCQASAPSRQVQSQQQNSQNKTPAQPQPSQKQQQSARAASLCRLAVDDDDDDDDDGDDDDDDDDDEPPALKDDSDSDEDCQHGKPAEVYKDQGNQLFKAGNWEGAAQAYSKGLEADKRSAVLYTNRAMCYEKLKQFKNAYADACKSLECDAQWYKGYLRKGKAEENLSMFPEALESFRLGLRCKVATDAAKVIQEFKQAFSEVSLVYGKLLRDKGELDKAKKILEDATNENPDSTLTEIKATLQEVKKLLELKKQKDKAQNPAAGSGSPAAQSPKKQATSAPAASSSSSSSSSAAAAAGGGQAPVSTDKQAFLNEAATLTYQAQAAASSNKLRQALDMHIRASKIREDVLGESHPICADSWHEMGVMYMELGEADNAFFQLDRAYNLRKKKKKNIEASSRWQTAVRLGQLYKGKLEFKDAIDLFSRAIEYYETQPSGTSDAMYIQARTSKETCQKLQKEKCWPVQLMNFVGPLSRLNGRTGTLYPALNNVILLHTGEEVYPPDRFNYGYLEEFGADELPPDLLAATSSIVPRKLAASGGGMSSADAKAEQEALRLLRAANPDGSAKFFLAELQKQPGIMDMTLSRVKNMMKELDAAEVSSPAPSQSDSMSLADSSIDKSAIRAQIWDEILKKFAGMVTCQHCTQEYHHDNAPYLAACGHSLCQECQSSASQTGKCLICKASIRKKPASKNFQAAEFIEHFLVLRKSLQEQEV